MNQGHYPTGQVFRLRRSVYTRLARHVYDSILEPARFVAGPRPREIGGAQPSWFRLFVSKRNFGWPRFFFLRRFAGRDGNVLATERAGLDAASHP